MKPRILFLDIETSPNLVVAFSLGGRNGYRLQHDDILHERYIICGAWKWAGEKTVHSVITKGKNDKATVKRLAAEIAKADVIVGHWGVGFDFPFIRGRLLFHGLDPLKPVREYDTCREAQRVFHLNSHKLDYLAKYLGVGGKIKTTKDLWLGCLEGDTKALQEMARYNREDVALLERVFNKMHAHLPAVVNQRLFAEKLDVPCCARCGSSDVVRKGTRLTRTRRVQLWSCNACGSWSRSSETNSKTE